MHRILISDSLDPSGLSIFAEAGVEVRQMKEEERPQLPEILADYDALVVRSTTKVTADLLKAGKRLKVVGRAGIGVDNVDVGAATDLGVLVVNAPTANLMSATEHTFALLLAVARRIPAADASTKAGGWDRKLTGVELCGKTLGIVGFGRIGQRVAARGRGFEMQVVAYDPFLDPGATRRFEVELVSLDDLLARADVITLHTPLTKETRNLLNRDTLARMRKGALLINCGRGGVVDEEALYEALESGHLGGAGLDVFAEEPPRDLKLVNHPRVVATPHLGAQTREAQERISIETAQMVLGALAGSFAIAAVNLPFHTTGGSRMEGLMSLGEILGNAASSLLGVPPQVVKIETWGIDEALRIPVSVAVVKGLLHPFSGDGVNYVNAERMAESRGIEVVRSNHAESEDYPHLVCVTVEGGEQSVSIGGVLFRDEPRVVRFEGFPLEFRPKGKLLVLENQDRPGVVGQIGTLLAEEGINIADIHLARREKRAIAVLRVDEDPPASVIEKLKGLEQVKSVRSVDLAR